MPRRRQPRPNPSNSIEPVNPPQGAQAAPPLTRITRATRRRFANQPSAFRVPNAYGITARGRLDNSDNLARRAETHAEDEVDLLAADMVQDATDRGYAQHTREEIEQSASEWTITHERAIEDHPNTGPTDPGDILTQHDIEEYHRRFPAFSLRDFNVHVFDYRPDDYAAFYARNQQTGEVLLQTANQQPFVNWNTFRQNLGRIAEGFLRAYMVPEGSMWIMQAIDEGTDAVLGEIVSDGDMYVEIADTGAQLENATMEDVMEQFEVGQSDFAPEEAYYRFIIANPGTGGAGVIPRHLKGVRCVWSTKSDGYCAPESLIMCDQDTGTRRNWNRRPGRLIEERNLLCDAIDSNKPVWGYDDLDKAAAHMNVNVVVLDAYTMVTVYDIDVEGADKTLHLILDQVQGHFMACYDPQRLSGDKSWCEKCKSLIKRQAMKLHNCDTHVCWACKTTFDSKGDLDKHFKERPPQEDDLLDIPQKPEWTECESCWRKLPVHCHEIHVGHCEGKSKKCPDCKETFLDSELTPHKDAISVAEHKAHCGEKCKRCPSCKEIKPKLHRCKITRTNTSYDHESDARELVVFDIESYSDEDKKQVPNFISVRRVVKSTKDEPQREYIARAREESEVLETFEGVQCLEQFCGWAATQRRMDFVAHNLRGYDGVLIHGYMRYTMRMRTKPIFNGLKVMSFKFGTNRMLDSLNHVATSLAKFPKTMGIKIPGLQKDHFPHRFNTHEHLNYVGPLPALEYYEPEEQSYESVAAITKWHEEESKKFTEENPWDINAVTRTYCNQDTLVLAVCLGEYRRCFIEMTGLDPIKCLTIASFCMKTYRNGHIPEEGLTVLSEYEDAFARKGLRGGRTECFKLRVKQEEMLYRDVVSLYPSVQFYDCMPVGVPTIWMDEPKELTELEQVVAELPADWLQREGYAKVDFTPFQSRRGFKKRHLIPVLGTTSLNGKLQFDLVAKTEQVVPINELRKAVELGYKIDKIHEVHMYERSDDLFKSYVCAFLKGKVESSDPPSNPDECIAEHRKRYGIELDREKLMAPQNKGMRSLCKLSLNSLWGKLAQRSHATTELCDPKDYFKLLQRRKKGEIDIVGLYVDPDLPGTVSVSYHEKAKFDDMTRFKTNVAVAGYVTSSARLRLYEVIGSPKLAGRIVYCDTDSCVWIKGKDGEFDHPKGQYLGEWTDEGEELLVDINKDRLSKGLPEHDSLIFNDFVGLGPKTYGIRDTRIEGASKLRAKGFRMTNKAKGLITFESLTACVEKGEETLIEYGVTFTRTKRDIFTGKSTKLLKYDGENGKRARITNSYELAPIEA